MWSKMKASERFQLILCVLGVVAGIIMLIWVISEGFNGYSGGYETFGGDFYTEIHKQVSHATDNLDDLIKMINAIMIYGSIVITIGFAVRLCSIFASVAKREAYENLLTQQTQLLARLTEQMTSQKQQPVQTAQQS